MIAMPISSYVIYVFAQVLAFLMATAPLGIAASLKKTFYWNTEKALHCVCVCMRERERDGASIAWVVLRNSKHKQSGDAKKG